MKTWMIYVAVAVVMMLIFVVFSLLKKKYIKDMSKVLYVDNDVDTYLNRLDNIEGKIFLNKKVRLFRKIDGFAIKNDVQGVVDTFKQLESLKLSFGQEVSLYEKEVDFYINNKMYEQAKVSNDKVQELSSRVEIPDLQKIADNCNALIDIYVNKNGKLANEMVKMGDEATIETVKGTYYFRAAKCFYYKKDNKMVDKYLNKALKNLNKTSWGPIIAECIEDHSQLENH